MNDIYYSKIAIGDNFLFLSDKPANDNEIDYFIDFYISEKVKTIAVLIPESDILDFYSVGLLKSYRDKGFNVIHYPIEDYSIPEQLDSFHSFILEITSRLNKGNLLIHCSAGIGRTGLVASSILISKGMSVDKAIRQIREVRPGSVENTEQRDFLEDYFKYLELRCLI